MTELLSGIAQSLWTDHGISVQMRVRMPSEHAATIDAAALPTYINGGGRQRAIVAVVGEARTPDDSGVHLLWYIEDSAGTLLHRCNP